MKDLSTTIIITALLLLPLAVWSETADFEVWNNRLAIPTLIPEPSRHTPHYSTGTFLPPIIKESLTLTPADNPILLTTTTRVSPNVTVTLTAGTAVYAHEFAGFIVAGHLVAEGTTAQPIQFISNEVHPLNQTWSGITVTKDGQLTITHADLHHASPAFTCLTGSNASLSNVHITDTSLGIFTTTPDCRLSHSRINSTRDGIVAIGVAPTVAHTKIFAARSDIVKIDETSN